MPLFSYLGTITQTSGAPSPSPPPHGGYPGYYGPPGGYWPPPSRPYSEPPPPHHGSPYYPPGGYWDGPPPRRQGPPSGPHPPPRQQQGYPPPQNWNQEVRSEQYGYPDSQGREGPSNRPPVPPQQRPPPNLRGYNDQPQQRRQQQQQFNHEESRGSRGPSPAPQSDNRYPGGPQRGYSAPAANPAPNRRDTFDDIYGSDYSNTPPPETHNQPSSSKTKYRTPRASVESDSDTEMDVEDTQYRLGNLHLSLTATDLTPVQAPKEKGKRGFMGLGKSKKAPA